MTADTPSDAAVRRVLDFWFGPPEAPDYGEPRECWFKPSNAFDAACRDGFFGDTEAAARGERDHWADTPEGALALVLLLDQMLRNLFRGEARGFDAALAHDTQRQFLYLPFEHSEDLADQDRAVVLLGALADPDLGVWAERHRAVIQRFGRFPHRNAALGRDTTAEEAAFLADRERGF